MATAVIPSATALLRARRRDDGSVELHHHQGHDLRCRTASIASAIMASSPTAIVPPSSTSVAGCWQHHDRITSNRLPKALPLSPMRLRAAAHAVGDGWSRSPSGGADRHRQIRSGATRHDRAAGILITMLHTRPHGRRIGNSWPATRRTRRPGRRRETQRPDRRQPAPRFRAPTRHPSPSRLPPGPSSISRRPLRSIAQATIPIAPVLPAAPFNPACNEVRSMRHRPRAADLTEASRFPLMLGRASLRLEGEPRWASRYRWRCVSVLLRMSMKVMATGKQHGISGFHPAW
jgi:hypothetical protein